MTKKVEKELFGITRIAGVCGLFIPVVMFTCLGLALASSPWFTWSEHALSDLGVQESTAALFNYGMIAGGVLIFIFSLGLIKILSTKMGAYLLLISSFALVGIGVFPETTYVLHFLTSASFFMILTLAFLIIGVTIKKDHFEKSMGLLALVFAFIAIVSSVLLFQLKGIALPEALSCFPAFMWCCIVGAKMTLA